MSPEQARAHAVDHRTDIYALGALVFEMCTGQLVFPANNAADMIAMHLMEPPRSAAALNPAVSPQLDALIVQMLAKQAADRPTLVSVREQLRTAMPSRAGTPVLQTGLTAPVVTSAPTSAPVRRTRTPVIAITALFAIGLGAGALYLVAGREARPPAPLPSQPAPVAPVAPEPPPTTTPEPAVAPVVVPEPSNAAQPAETDSATPSEPPAKRATGKRGGTTKRAGTAKPAGGTGSRKAGSATRGEGAGSAADDDAPM